jgi:putative DNA primase/helicase
MSVDHNISAQEIEALVSGLHSSSPIPDPSKRRPNFQRNTIVSVETIPRQLTEHPQWVCWKYATRKDKKGVIKFTKPPINPKTGRLAKSNDPATHSDFQTAINYAQTSNKVSGIGFVFTEGDKLWGIDIDHCVKKTPDGLVFSPHAQDVLAHFKWSYCEISPSGEGLRIFCFGQLPPERKSKVAIDSEQWPEQAIEWYDYTSPRYLTVTGNIIPSVSKDVLSQPDALEWLHQKYFTKPKRQPKQPTPIKPSVQTPPPVQTNSLSDDDVITICQKARNSSKFNGLWSGGGDSDASRGDLSLCGILAFYTHSEMGGSDSQLDSIFRRSGRMRPKWDEKHHNDGRTYGQGTIDMATSRLTATYVKKAKSVRKSKPVPTRVVQSLGTKPNLPTPSADANAPVPVPYHFIGKFPMTDTGNAERFADMHRDKARYCSERGKWFVWDGTRWKIDKGGQRVKKLATKAVRDIHHEVANLALSKEEVANLSNWAIRSESKTASAAMIDRAQAELEIMIEDLDTNPMLLNVENGTIDLTTGKLLPHNPKDLITRKAATAYDPDAKCPQWIEFINWCFKGDQKTIDYVQRAVGYSLTGLMSEQSIFILYGGGDNGKSTFIDCIKELLGEYAQLAPTNLLIKQRNDKHTADIITLKGSRLVSASEIAKKSRLDEALVKQLTNKTIKARYMRQDHIEFKQEHTIWLDTNHKPAVGGSDHGIWKRLKLIEFENKIAECDMDGKLDQKLRAEFFGMLTWCVIGCLKWQREGLKDAPSVAKAGEAYKSEENVIGRFIAEMLVSVPDGRIISTGMYVAYKEWCEANGERALSNSYFGADMKKAGHETKKSHGKKVYRGLGLVLSDKQSMHDLGGNPSESSMNTRIETKGGMGGMHNPIQLRNLGFHDTDREMHTPPTPSSSNPNKYVATNGGMHNSQGMHPQTTTPLTPAQIVLAHLEAENRRVSYLDGILDYSFEMVIKEILPELEESGLVVNYPNVFELELRG